MKKEILNHTCAHTAGTQSVGRMKRWHVVHFVAVGGEKQREYCVSQWGIKVANPCPICLVVKIVFNVCSVLSVCFPFQALINCTLAH